MTAKTASPGKGSLLSRIVKNQIFIPIAALLVLTIFNLIVDPSFFEITLKCGVAEFDSIDSSVIVGYRKSQFNVEALVNNKHLAKEKYPNVLIDPATIEDIMLYYVRGDKK